MLQEIADSGPESLQDLADFRISTGHRGDGILRVERLTSIPAVCFTLRPLGILSHARPRPTGLQEPLLRAAID